MMAPVALASTIQTTCGARFVNQRGPRASSRKTTPSNAFFSSHATTSSTLMIAERHHHQHHHQHHHHQQQQRNRRNRTGVAMKAAEDASDISMVERKRDLTTGDYVQPEITSRSTSRRLVPEEGFNAARVSFGTIGMSVGLPLLLYGFGAYFSFLPGTGVSAIMLIYGFPISLIGFALKYAELLPLECESYEDAVNVREEQATAVLTQLRNDVTRYRYGDEQHLEEAMNIVFKFNRPGGLQKRQRPKLIGVAEQMVNGRYAIVLTFESPRITKEEWDGFMGKFSRFFGPNVDAVAVEKSEGVAEIILISNGGDDLGGPGDDMEVLPPLMPGLPPRYQKKGTA